MEMEAKPSSHHRLTTTDDIEVSTYLEIAKELQGKAVVIEKPEQSLELDTVVVMDFGSQYSMLIARRVRECHVYCELLPHDTPWEKIASLNPKGFILSGGPASVYEAGAPLAPAYIYESRLPILGICYGMQLIAHQLSGEVSPGARHEYGHMILHLADESSPLFRNLPSSLPVWMSHGDMVTRMPPEFKSMAYTENSPVAVMGNGKGIFGLQFHPRLSILPTGKPYFKTSFTRFVVAKVIGRPAIL